MCYEDCPAGTTADNKNMSCLGCLAGCNLCDAEEPALCLICQEPLYVYKGDCISSCPEGYRINYERTACVERSKYDFGIIPFPFLICASIIIMICCFTKIKKKTVLRAGRPLKVSTQKTVTCILAYVAPVAYLAAIAQLGLSMLFSTWKFAIVTGIFIAIAFTISVVFQIMYGTKFNNKKMSADNMRRYKEGKIKKQDLHKYTQPTDKLFSDYVRKHKCVNSTVSVLTVILTFKVNKLYYSHFLMFDMFKAKWSDHKTYRKMMTWYCMIWMIFVDAPLAIVAAMGCYVGFQNGEWNQLIITFIEVFVLSLLGIFLGAYELYKLKDYLKYSDQGKLTAV